MGGQKQFLRSEYLVIGRLGRNPPRGISIGEHHETPVDLPRLLLRHFIQEIPLAYSYQMGNLYGEDQDETLSLAIRYLGIVTLHKV